jgi:hypothetical protein
MSDYYRHVTAVCAVPCLKCDGVVKYGDLLNLPAEEGGDYRGSYLSCTECGWEAVQALDDTAEELPGEFFDVLFHLVGWDIQGFYVNCCEGPVLEDGWGNHPMEPTA